MAGSPSSPTSISKDTLPASTLFKLFVDTVQDYAIFLLDLNGRVTSWNTGAERIKGYKASEILGRHFSCFYPQDEAEAGKPARLLSVAARQGRVEDEGWRIRNNGEKFWASVVITAIRNGEGDLIGFGKVTRDLTERKQKEAALLREEQRFHLFVQSVQDYAVFMLDTDGKISSWNLGAERIKGYQAAEIIGKHFSCFYPEDVRNEKPARELKIAAEMGRFEDEGWRLRKDGSRFWANVVITAVRDESGQLIGFGKVTRDLTGWMLAQKSLEQARMKLADSEASLRELSLHLLRTQDEERRKIGRDIHDSLGQYLSALKIKLDLMDASNIEAKKCAELADECIKQVRTISYLLYPPMLEEMGLTSAIPWYLEGFSNRSNIKTTFQSAPDLGRLSREAELVLFRVLQESLTNVQRHSGSASAAIKLSRKDKGVELEVLDYGKGVNNALLEQGTRDWMGSLGVGLRGMSERLRQIGGVLEVSSSPEGGTRVRALVPDKPRSDNATDQPGKKEK